MPAACPRATQPCPQLWPLLRAGKIVGFVTGAALMVPAATRFGFMAFMLPACLVLGATALSFVPSWIATDVPPRSVIGTSERRRTEGRR